MHKYGHWKKTLALLVMSALSLGASTVEAMPEGGVVRSGSASVTQNGKEMTIRQDSGRMAMDWTGFSVGKDETVRFQQPGKDALALNRVTGNQQSVIDGSLLSNGHVLLVNPNGVVIGKNASIDVGGLVASTAHVKDNFMKEFGNSTGAFTLGGVSDGKIINEGTINAEGGLVALHAAKVENSGTITNNGGSVVMAAADKLTLTPDADGKLNFTVDGKTAEASALNKGTITADGGTILMTADSASDVMSTVVNNSGTLQARTLRKNEKGQILLEGNDKGQVEVSGTLDASGTEKDQDAGNIKVMGRKTIVHDGTNLLAKGDVNGGKIETSGDVLSLGDGLNIDASGDKGNHGTWLLDPLEVVISAKPSSADHEYGNVAGDTNGKTKNNVIYNDPPSKQNANNAYNSTTWIDSKQVGTILAGGTDVIIQAISTSGAASITLESPIDITVTNSAKKNPTFTLEANRNITINKEITAESGGKGLNIMLNADTDGDGIGAVIINADIATNGGNFTSVTGGKVTHTSKGTAGQYGQVNVGGAPAHEHLDDPKYNPATVGTYFGDANSASGAQNRKISTNGGAITLNGEVAIGLNGGTLELDTNGGALTVTGIVNSGNSYDYYYYDAITDTWDKPSDDAIIKIINGYVDKVLKGTEGVPMYEYKGVNYSKDKDGNLTWTYDAVYYPAATNGNAPHYVFRPLSADEANDSGSFITRNTNNGDHEDTTNFSHTLITSDPKWYLTKQAGWGFNSFIVTGKSGMSIEAFLTYLKNTYANKATFNSRYPNGTNYSAFTDAEKANLKKDITSYLAHNWYVAQEMASTGSKGNGDQVGDSYLATITTRLENSLTTPNGAHIMWAGGRGSGVRNRNNKNDPNNVVTWYPADPTHPDGFYWVTGPEGLATDNQSNYNDTTIGTGTKFWDTSLTDVQKDSNNYGQSVFGEAHWSTNLVGHQPDDNGPFLTVGYGSDNQWDDANFGGETTVGFVRETNLANSSLKINTGSGAVNLQGNIGGSQKLDTVTVNTTGNVTTGGSKITDYNMGTIHADHGVTIKGKNVTIGGRISSGASTETVNTDSSVVTDNVTITAAGDITVHGITADGKTDENGKVTNGGKIKLTSTADNGVIKLESTANSNKDDYTTGNNKHEGDKEKDDGTLIAGSTENGAVIMDAQGKTGAFINEAQGALAITTGVVKDENGNVKQEGTWQVYVNSPSDYGTQLGDNLISGTNAQWTAKSSANSAVKTNSSKKNLTDYTDTSSNKFIFQVTPVITISGGYASKTYGDNLSEQTMTDTLTSKATYKDSKENDIDVTGFKNNFDESGYLTYVTSSDGMKTGLSTVSVFSDGAKETATRTNGNEKVEGSDAYKTAADGKQAFYVMDVAYQDGVKTLNGYDKAVNDGEVEIKRKTLTIKTDATQTYGDPTIKLGTPSDYESQLVGKDKLNANDITYSISTTGDYAKSKGTNPTAHVRKEGYSDEYLTTGAAIKDGDGNDASANYEVNGSGTITVNPADLVIQLKNVSTTYGQKFDEKAYGYNQDNDYLKGLLKNGDDASVITDNIKNDAIHYINTGAVTDADKNKRGIYTADAGTNYTISSSDTISLQDYNVTFTSGKSTVNKAILTVDTTGKTRTYGDVTNVASDVKNAARFHVAGGTAQTVNGDSYDDILKEMSLSTKSDALVTSDDGKVKTGNANTDPGYDITAVFKTDLTNYTVTEGVVGKEKIEKAALVVDTKGNTRTYGDVTNVASDVKNAASFHVAGGTDQTVNGDSYDDILKEMNLSTKSDALVTDTTGKTKTGNANTDLGYYIKAAFKNDLTNYTVTKGVVGKEKIEKADLTLTLKDVSTTYGSPFDASTYGYKKGAADLQGLTNGDAATAITDVLKDSDFTYVNGGEKSDSNNKDVRTQDAGKYQITGSTSNTLDNYNIKVVNPGNSTVSKKAITVENEMNQIYGEKDSTTFSEIVLPDLANGDKLDTTKGSKFTISLSEDPNTPYNQNRKNRDTADVGEYADSLKYSGGGIVHNDGTDAYKNYDVTIKGIAKVHPKDIYTEVIGKGSTLNDLTWTILRDPKDQMGNGDSVKFTYTPGNLISYDNQTFDVNSFINGTPTYGSTTDVFPYGKNYIFHSTGRVQLTFNPIVKPDVWAHSGGYRPRNKIETSLPVFRVEDEKVGQYGTYGVEHREDEDKLVLSATGMRLPEPDQVPDEDRTFTTTLSTEEGSGKFKLEYNGVSLKVYPQDKKAEEVVRAGDKTKNVSLSEKALYVGYTEMGLDLIDLKGVYIYFN